MEYVVIPDTAIFAINIGRQDNESSNIVYRDENGRLHSIDFEICAANYSAEHNTASKNCIGERNRKELYFIFYTSGIKTKVVFEKIQVGNILRYHRLSGSIVTRFLELRTSIIKTKYTTHALSWEEGL